MRIELRPYRLLGASSDANPAVHLFLALVDDNGNVLEELHGLATKDGAARNDTIMPQKYEAPAGMSDVAA